MAKLLFEYSRRYRVSKAVYDYICQVPNLARSTRQTINGFWPGRLPAHLSAYQKPLYLPSKHRGLFHYGRLNSWCGSLITAYLTHSEDSEYVLIMFVCLFVCMSAYLTMGLHNIQKILDSIAIQSPNTYEDILGKLSHSNQLLGKLRYTLTEW